MVGSTLASSSPDLAIVDEYVAPKKNDSNITDIKPKVVVVERGDWLMKISRQFSRFSISWQDIFLANKEWIQNPNLIYPGQRLVIP